MIKLNIEATILDFAQKYVPLLRSEMEDRSVTSTIFAVTDGKPAAAESGSFDAVAVIPAPRTLLPLHADGIADRRTG